MFRRRKVREAAAWRWDRELAAFYPAAERAERRARFLQQVVKRRNRSLHGALVRTWQANR
jgi:hypothetical protein